ncbi:MAG: Rrf2 family transcriptional regulator [Flavobacteriaceae bacterium]|nr:Rrf2 family transcriptional regulator [Flavobacteriaceae bacterium]
MMISNTSKYAIRGVLYLALNSDDKTKFSPGNIAKDIEVPAPFLAKTLQLLSKKNLISSSKGRNGGFYLTEIDRQNLLISIVDCIDGLEKFYECGLGLRECTNINPCPIHNSLSSLRQGFLKELSSRSIDDFAHEIRNGKTHLTL